MNLDKAIEIKIQWRKDNYPPPLADEMNADMMSIEAMKRIKAIRPYSNTDKSYYLTGETKE